MSDSDTTRRRFLQGAAGSGLVAVAGCLGLTDDESSGDDGGMNDGEDGGMDGGEDGGMDGGEDGGMDGGEDGGMDGGEDGGMDGGEDGGMDGGEDGGMTMEPTDPDEASVVSVDRFSTDAGTLFVRENNDALPGPDEPIDFDQGPFITTGLGPDGSTVQYYNFDVMSTTPAPIYALFHENGDPVEGQLNIVDVVPGDDGYNDFWHVHKVTVPDDYTANTITSASQLLEHDYDIQPTGTIKNCPVVPEGSTAEKSHENDDSPSGTVRGWYQGEVVHYLLFAEDSFEAQDGQMPVSPIHVSFNVNPGEDGGGPASGFRTEEGSDQTHNVVATLPGDDTYSPLWDVKIYDNAEFDSVSDLASARDATQLADGPTVNCPIVSTE